MRKVIVFTLKLMSLRDSSGFWINLDFRWAKSNTDPQMTRGKSPKNALSGTSKRYLTGQVLKLKFKN